MEKQEAWKPTIGLIILDMIGAVLVGIGMAEKFAQTNLVPESFQFENYDLVMIVVGFMLMTPMSMSLIRHIQSKARHRPQPPYRD